MVRRTSSAAVCVAVAVAFTSSWYVSAQSSRQASLSAASRATPAAAALNPASSPEALGFDSTMAQALLDEACEGDPEE